MDSSKVPRHAEAVIDKCELCDLGNDARWYCTDCDEEMCKQCKVIHLRSKQSRNHNVIKIAADIETSGDRAKRDKEYCSSHPKELLRMFCLNCEVPVCVSCIADKQHNTHSFDKLENVLNIYKQKLSAYVDSKKEEVTGLQLSLKAVQDNVKIYRVESDNTLDEIEKRREELKSWIDKATVDLVQEMEENKRSDIKALKTQISEIRKLISEKEDILRICEEHLQSDIYTSMIRFAVDIQHNSEQVTPFYTTHIIPPMFVKSDSTHIPELVGHMESGGKEEKVSVPLPVGKMIQNQENSVTFDSAVEHEKTMDTTVVANIYPGIQCECVSALSNRQAWCGHGYYKGSDVALVNMDGQVLKNIKLDFHFSDIAVTSTGELLLTNEHKIKRYTQQGEFIDVIDTSPEYMYGIAVTSSDEILIFIDDYVLRLTTTGQIKQTIGKDDSSPFGCPYSITENINQDICVVDICAEDCDFVVVVNKDGHCRFVYPDKDSENITHCSGIACDKLGFILLSDFHEHRVHQTDKDGRFVRYILTTQHGVCRPRGLSVDEKGQLWVCNESDESFKLTVVKYRK